MKLLFSNLAQNVCSTCCIWLLALLLACCLLFLFIMFNAVFFFVLLCFALLFFVFVCVKQLSCCFSYAFVVLYPKDLKRIGA